MKKGVIIALIVVLFITNAIFLFLILQLRKVEQKPKHYEKIADSVRVMDNRAKWEIISPEFESESKKLDKGRHN